MGCTLGCPTSKKFGPPPLMSSSMLTKQLMKFYSILPASKAIVLVYLLFFSCLSLLLKGQSAAVMVRTLSFVSFVSVDRTNRPNPTVLFNFQRKESPPRSVSSRRPKLLCFPSKTMVSGERLGLGHRRPVPPTVI